MVFLLVAGPWLLLLCRPLPKHFQAPTDFLDRQPRDRVYTLLFQLHEHRVRLLDPADVAEVVGFDCVEEQEHARVEGLLACGPGDEGGGHAEVEEEEGGQNGEGGREDRVASAWRR